LFGLGRAVVFRVLIDHFRPPFVFEGVGIGLPLSHFPPWSCPVTAHSKVHKPSENDGVARMSALPPPLHVVLTTLFGRLCRAVQVLQCFSGFVDLFDSLFFHRPMPLLPFILYL
jgi:hypothetical protein